MEESMLCIVQHYSTKHNNPLHSDVNLKLPPAWLKVWKNSACLCGRQLSKHFSLIPAGTAVSGN